MTVLHLWRDRMATTKLSPRLAIGVCFTLALVPRLFLFGYLIGTPEKFFFYDSAGYVQRALNLVYHGSFSSAVEAPWMPDVERTPLYPVMLALVAAITNHFVVVWIGMQTVIAACTALLTFWVGRQLQLGDGAAFLAAVTVAVEPLSIMTSVYVLTETVFTFLLVAGVGCVARGWQTGRRQWIVLAAVVFALAALTRPISQWLTIAMLPLFALRRPEHARRSVATALLFVGVSLALTYSWAVRNYHATGMFTLSTISDTNLIYYRARAVLAAAHGEGQEATRRHLEEAVQQQAAAQNLGPAQRIQVQRRMAIDILTRYPWLTLRMTLEGAGRLLFDPGYTTICTLLDRTTTSFDCFPGQDTMNDSGVFGKAWGKMRSMSVFQRSVLLSSMLLVAVLYGYALRGGLLMLSQRQWFPLALLVMLLVYFVGLSAGAEANSRFRVPLVPFLALLSGVSMARLWSRLIAITSAATSTLAASGAGTGHGSHSQGKA